MGRFGWVNLAFGIDLLPAGKHHPRAGMQERRGMRGLAKHYVAG